MKTLFGMLVGLVAIVTSPIWIIGAIVGGFFDSPVNWSPSEVEEWLQRMAAGEPAHYWWDDFLSRQIKDEPLDAIRLRCETICDHQSGYLVKDSENNFVLSAEGKAEIEKLIIKCREIKVSDVANHA